MKILPFPSTIIIVFLDKQINTWQFFFHEQPTVRQYQTSANWYPTQTQQHPQFYGNQPISAGQIHVHSPNTFRISPMITCLILFMHFCTKDCNKVSPFVANISKSGDVVPVYPVSFISVFMVLLPVPFGLSSPIMDILNISVCWFLYFQSLFLLHFRSTI